MGSAGRDRISDYPPNSRRPTPPVSEGAAGGGSSGGDPCLAHIDEFELEEIANSEYFAEHEALPPRGTEVGVAASLLGPRLAVEVSSTGELLGLLPTRLNYLRNCLDTNRYIGHVTSVSTTAVPSVWVQLEPHPR